PAPELRRGLSHPVPHRRESGEAPRPVDRLRAGRRCAPGLLRPEALEGPARPEGGALPADRERVPDRAQVRPRGQGAPGPVMGGRAMRLAERQHPRRRIAAVAVALAGLLHGGVGAGPALAASAGEIDRSANAALTDLYRKTPDAKVLGDRAVAVLIFPS